MITEHESNIQEVQRCIAESLNGMAARSGQFTRREVLDDLAATLRRSEHVRREHVEAACRREVEAGTLTASEAADL